MPFVVDVLVLVIENGHHAGKAPVDLDGHTAEAPGRSAHRHYIDRVPMALEIALDEQRFARLDQVLGEAARERPLPLRHDVSLLGLKLEADALVP